MAIAMVLSVAALGVIAWRIRHPLAKSWARLLQRIASVFAVLLLIGIAGWYVMVMMPGQSFQGPVPNLANRRAQMRARLEADVNKLSLEIGERNVHRNSAGLMAACEMIEQRFVE